MPLHTSSHNLRTWRSKKDGRKRTSSTVSNSTQISQAGSVESPKTAEKNNAPKQTVKPPAASQPSPDKPAEPAKQVPNVFEFLEENDDSSSESASESSSESSDDDAPSDIHAQALAKIQSPKPRNNPVPHALLAGTNPGPKSTMSSQSRTTSRSSSDSRPPPAPPAPVHEKQMQVTRKKASSRKSSTASDYPRPMAAPSPPPSKRQLQISRPENYYHPTKDAVSVHRSPLPPSPPSSPEDSLHRGTPIRRRDSSLSQASSGYGLIASHLTHSASEDKSAFPPLYRRFESVNHRVLLHLQDEISQMEEDLQALDEYEEMHRVATAEQEGTKTMPASRRMDVQSQAYSSLHYRRMDLMAALTQKSEQYSKEPAHRITIQYGTANNDIDNALSAYSKVLQTLPRASEDDIKHYRGWMKEHNPIAAAETRFLDQNADLVSLTPRLAASAAAAPVYTAIIIASGAILLPLLAFSMIAEFSGRLVVVTVVGAAAAAIAANYSAGIDTLVDSRDGWRCASLYFGFMTLAAMFIP